ncbi:uracil-DNA glycosylase [Rhodococcus fascians]|nr:uracil-DNA glycosylase [Rhodococcus fascians]MBY4239555.1 uracil-DNA glycosylase [Rhodococcus fascians]MBY4253713.1 uracil-DNA glycosylase [Rhodococcus fascians]MBY4271144.1 uracil-DNA glycosylase [Rhodococcus fascians]
MRPNYVKNKLAYERGQLLSKDFAPHNVENKLARRYDDPRGVLNMWVDETREKTGESIPYFDPDAGIEGVRVLMLLQDPSNAADGESGFISRYNNDPTAQNVYKTCEATGLRYETYLPWNVVPWWVMNPAMGGQGRTLANQAARARPYLIEFLDLLPEAPAVIILSGNEAQKAWRSATKTGVPANLRGAKIFDDCPHPAGQAYNNIDHKTGIKNSIRLERIFAEAAQRVGNT